MFESKSRIYYIIRLVTMSQKLVLLSNLNYNTANTGEYLNETHLSEPLINYDYCDYGDECVLPSPIFSPIPPTHHLPAINSINRTHPHNTHPISHNPLVIFN